jgi:hypothetical protein
MIEQLAQPCNPKHNAIFGTPENLYRALNTMGVNSSGELTCTRWTHNTYMPDMLIMAERGFIYAGVLPYAAKEDFGLLEIFINYTHDQLVDSECFVAPYRNELAIMRSRSLPVPDAPADLERLLTGVVHHKISSEFPEFMPHYRAFLAYVNE